MKLNMKVVSEEADILCLGDNCIETGPMGDCVSVVVLANKMSGEYQDVRGFHGLGGIENVNFASLLSGISKEDIRICVFLGTLQRSAYAKENIGEILITQLSHYDIETEPEQYDYTNARVYRNGKIEEIR